jgi:hypothetical protein
MGIAIAVYLTKGKAKALTYTNLMSDPLRVSAKQHAPDTVEPHGDAAHTEICTFVEPTFFQQTT